MMRYRILVKQDVSELLHGTRDVTVIPSSSGKVTL